MDTAERITDFAEELIMKGGYNAFSFHDIAPRVGIRTASIHYHFRTKEALVLRVVERYVDRIRDAQDAIDAAPTLEPSTKLSRYLGVFREVAKSPDRICLCGALGAELSTLPEAIQQMVTRFYSDQIRWLARLLAAGRREGAFAFSGPPDEQAGLMFAALQGALLITRSTADTVVFDGAVRAMKRTIRVARS